MKSLMIKCCTSLPWTGAKDPLLLVLIFCSFHVSLSLSSFLSEILSNRILHPIGRRGFLSCIWLKMSIAFKSTITSYMIVEILSSLPLSSRVKRPVFPRRREICRVAACVEYENWIESSWWRIVRNHRKVLWPVRTSYRTWPDGSSWIVESARSTSVSVAHKSGRLRPHNFHSANSNSVRKLRSSVERLYDGEKCETASNGTGEESQSNTSDRVRAAADRCEGNAWRRLDLVDLW